MNLTTPEELVLCWFDFSDNYIVRYTGPILAGTQNDVEVPKYAPAGSDACRFLRGEAAGAHTAYEKAGSPSRPLTALPAVRIIGIMKAADRARTERGTGG